MKIYLVCSPRTSGFRIGGYPIIGAYGSKHAAKASAVRYAQALGYEIDNLSYRFINDVLYTQQGDATTVYIATEVVQRGAGSR